jgi:hypothetical protein
MFLLSGSFGFILDRAVGIPLFGYHDLWQQDAIHHDSRVYSFFVGMFGIPQHMLGFYAVVLAWMVATQLKLANERAKIASLILLLAAAFYTSAFAFLPLLFFLVTRFRFFFERMLRYKFVVAACFAICVPPIVVFLNKPESIHFVWMTSSKLINSNWAAKVIPASIMLSSSPAIHGILLVLAFPIWFVLVSAVDMLGLPLFLLPVLRRLGRFERDLNVSMLIFFSTTYFVGFTDANNYSLAGSFLPHFVFGASVLRQLERTRWQWLRPDWRVPMTALPMIFALSVSGNLVEENWNLQFSLQNWSPLFALDAQLYRMQDEPWHMQLLNWLKRKKIDPQTVNRDPNPIFARDIVGEFNRDVRPEVEMQSIWGWFVEKFQLKKPADFAGGEKEMLRYPIGQSDAPRP